MCEYPYFLILTIQRPKLLLTGLRSHARTYFFSESSNTIDFKFKIYLNLTK